MRGMDGGGRRRLRRLRYCRSMIRRETWRWNMEERRRQAFLGAPRGKGGNYPANNTNTPNLAVGASAGFGAGMFLTNAGSVAALKVRFTSLIVNLPFVSAEVDWSNGVIVGALSVGAVKGLPASVQILQTNTF